MNQQLVTDIALYFDSLDCSYSEQSSTGYWERWLNVDDRGIEILLRGDGKAYIQDHSNDRPDVEINFTENFKKEIIQIINLLKED